MTGFDRAGHDDLAGNQTFPPSRTRSADGDVDRADAVVTAFNLAVGDDPSMRRAAWSIAVSGGGPRDVHEAMLNQINLGDAGFNRPWFWLAACAEEAGAQGRAPTVGRIALFVWYFSEVLAPNLTMTDQLDMMLRRAPDETLVRMFTTAIYALKSAHPATLVIDRGDDSVSVEQLLEISAVGILNHVHLTTPDVVATARRIMGHP